MPKALLLSVHQLVDFLLRTGDIDNRVYNQDTMREGTRLHGYYQARQGLNYLSEFFLKDTFFVEDFAVTLFGRADGIILGDTVTIDEIKTTVSDLDAYFAEQKAWHLGQAKCYALLYARLTALDHIDVRLTYINQLDNRRMIKTFAFTRDELEKDIAALLREYIAFYRLILRRREMRNRSAGELKFPFPSFRRGQRKLAKYAYGVARNGGILFVEAPTGIGKTMSTLFPFAKSFADGENERIFYLTAKNSGKAAAALAVDQLREAGLFVSSIIITAKEKICLAKGKACNPDECPFAKGYYTHVREVLTDLVKNEVDYTPEKIVQVALDKGLCPFELSLDLSLFTDVVICDYNYFFDPQVYLRRYFDEDASRVLLLVDEAHNLVDRGREMYSASVDLRSFMLARKCYRKFPDKKIRNAARRIGRLFGEFATLPEGETLLDGLSLADQRAIEAYLVAASGLMKNHHEVVDDDFMNFYFALNRFAKLYDLFDDTFAFYVTRGGEEETKIDLFCLAPGSHLKSSLDKVKGKILFSATLSPYRYYIDMVGGSPSDPVLLLPSPFPRENLLLLVAPTVSTKYRKRSETYQSVADYLAAFVGGRIGNYFVYVPSYEYLEALGRHLVFPSGTDVLLQTKDMTEEDKAAFLACFKEHPEKTTVGVAVVGGAFGEGIDLVSERLIGVAVVGVGLPQICFERNLIRDYFDGEGKEDGYRYSYLYPGMNKVMQAVGRLIRSEDDRGAALLVDDRYLSDEYRLLFADKWRDYQVVTSIDDVKEEISAFWKKGKSAP